MRSQLSQPHLNELLNACVRLCVCARAPMCVCLLVLACARSQMLFLPSALADAQRGANTPAAPGCALQAHLAKLERLGAILFTYRNLEAVPEELECTDPFGRVSLFKQHRSVLDERVGGVSAAMRYWTDADDAGGELFRFYSNGKSIVRVCDAIVEVGSVHEWKLPSREAAATAGFTNNSTLKLSAYVYHQLMRTAEVGGACLLHYACCSFATFWAKRWAALGYASPNHRFRGGGGGLDQRANALALGARRAEAEAFYRRSMMCDDEGEKRRQLQSGVCVRIAAYELVHAARACLLPPEVTAAEAAPAAPPAAPPPTSVGVSTPRAAASPTWLSAADAASVDATNARLRQRGMAAVGGDAVFEEMVGQAIEEATSLAHAMTAEAHAMVEAAPAETTRLLATRRLPPASSAAGDGESYTRLYEALLTRALRTTLQLLHRVLGSS